MNFDSLHTHNSSSQRAFEAFCNQLFEQWLRRTYRDTLTHFATVNGAGGDGGVEAYGMLSKGNIIGVQAKWFRNSLGPAQIKKITESVETALQVRPLLIRYIICLPRDLQSDKIGKQGQLVANTEERHILTMVDKLQAAHPGLTIELWTEHRLRTELQYPGNEGIRKYWFDREIITIDFLQKRFELARAGWLRERYIPDLHAQGDIDLLINKLLYNTSYREDAIEQIQFYCTKYEEAIEKLAHLAGLLNDAHPLKNELLETTGHIQAYVEMDREDIRRLVHGESIIHSNRAVPGAFIELLGKIGAVHLPNTFRNAVAAVRIPLLLLKSATRPITYTSSGCCMITGGPARGKTHGVTHAVAQRLKQGLPALIIQARAATATSWANILQEALGGLHTWTDFEILRGLEALAHTCDINNVLRDTGSKTLKPAPTRVLICVDGIDEARDDANWLLRIREVKALQDQFTRIVFVFTMRYQPIKPIDFTQTKWHNDWMTHLFLSAEGSAPVATLVPQYLEHFGIRYQNSPWIRQAFRDALSLKLFCEAYAGQDIDTTHKAVTTSLTRLLNNKIQRLTEEFVANSQPAGSPPDHLIRRLLLALPNFLKGKQAVTREDLIALLQATDPLHLPFEAVAQALDLFCQYGIVNQELLPAEDDLLPVTTQYSITYQSYLDYFVAITTVREIISKQLYCLSEQLKQAYAENTLVFTARILFEDHHLLLGENGFMTGELDAGYLLVIQLMVLQHSSTEKIKAYLPQMKEQFLRNSEARLDILNYLIKPCLKTEHRNLMVDFAIDLIRHFPDAAAREQAWESPPVLVERGDTLLNINDYLDLELYIDDTGDGAPLLLAWSLAYPDHFYREGIREDLITWAIDQPDELIRLLNHFFPGHETQIQEDLLVVLASVALQTEQGLHEMAAWAHQHIIAPADNAPHSNPVILQCCRAVVEKANRLGACSDELYTQCVNSIASQIDYLYIPPLRPWIPADSWIGGPLADPWYIPEDIAPRLTFSRAQLSAALAQQQFPVDVPDFGKWLLPRELPLLTDAHSTQAWYTLYNNLQLNEPHYQASGNLKVMAFLLPRQQFATFEKRLPGMEQMKKICEHSFHRKARNAGREWPEEGAAYEITEGHLRFRLLPCIAGAATKHLHSFKRNTCIPTRQVRDWLHIITLYDDVVCNAAGEIKGFYNEFSDQHGGFQEIALADRSAFEQGAAAAGLVPFWLVWQSNNFYLGKAGDHTKYGDFRRYWIVWQEAGKLCHRLWWQQEPAEALDQ